MARIVRLADHKHRRQPTPVYFNRTELNTLLALYSRRVAKGDWRDYAIGHDPGIARFSVFRHSHETPLFTVVKRMVSGRLVYAVFDGDRKLRQSSKLTEALAVIDKQLKLIGG